MSPKRMRTRRWARRGTVAPLVALMCPVLIGFVALSVDLGLLYTSHAEAQRAADAGALAGASQLLDDDTLAGNPDKSTEQLYARWQATEYAWLNEVNGVDPYVYWNTENHADGDVVVGYVADPTDRTTPLSTADPDAANAVCVRVRRDADHQGSIGLIFARIFGLSHSDVVAEATAMIDDRVVGFAWSEAYGNPDLMPFALHIDSWNALMSGDPQYGDRYDVVDGTDQVTMLPDGIPELNLYPGAGVWQLPPGNFGTVDIGSSANSTDDIVRQILEGVSKEDLEYHGGELRLGEGNVLFLNGDTGISAGIKSALEKVKGQPRSILLFDQVSGPGDNATYRIIGFAGIRIVNVRLTGAATRKEVLIQPSHVVDGTVITGANANASYFVYRPPQLIR